MNVSELVKILDYDFVGEDVAVSGISYANEAKNNEIAVIRNKSEIKMVNSNIILSKPVLTPLSKTMIITYDDLGFAIKKITEVLIDNGILHDYSLSVNFYETKRKFFVGTDCYIDEGTEIYPNVYIGNYVHIGKGCIIEPNVVIGAGTIIEDNVCIGSGSKVGAESFYHYYDEHEKLHQFNGIGRTIVKAETKIGSNTIIQKGTISDTVIGKNCMIGNCVDIGHDVKIGNNCKIVSQTGIAGNAIIRNNVLIYGQSGISNDVIIGNNVVVKAKTIVSKNIKDNDVVFGLYGRSYNEELRINSKIRKDYSRKEV